LSNKIDLVVSGVYQINNKTHLLLTLFDIYSILCFNFEFLNTVSNFSIVTNQGEGALFYKRLHDRLATISLFSWYGIAGHGTVPSCMFLYPSVTLLSVRIEE